MREKRTESIKFQAEFVRYEDRRGEFKILEGLALNEKGTGTLGHCAIKGSMPDITEGDELFAMGYWEEHPKYGRSLKVSAYVKCMPTREDGILNYLNNGNIDGITKKRAKDIVQAFGSQTFDVLLHTPERLKEIRGIGQKSLEKISKSARETLEQQNMMAAVMMYIQGFGISPAYAKRIFARYGPESMDIIRKNPYRLAEDVKGIGFLKADEIALKNGVEKDSPYRVESAILYILKQMQDNGNVFGIRSHVTEQSHEFLLVKQELIEAAIERLLENRKLQCRGNNDLYLPKLYYAEIRAAENFVRVARADGHCFDVPDDKITETGQASGIPYADAQIKAIRTACGSSVSVITGGPGTGKTTITNGIIRLCTGQHLSVSCAAPTGKAAKRMSEATGTEAKTIHKLLEVFYDEEKKIPVFGRNECHPLDADVLIVDECSMISLCLFDSLLKAVKPGTKLILVGDTDQLPSVGCGNVLHDVIHSGAVPVERLGVIFRQAQESRIIQNAHRINSGEMPVLKNKKDGDFFFVNTKGMEPETIRDKIVEYVCDKLPKYYNVDPDEVQVLAPMKKGHTGVYELNNFIQDRRCQKKDGPVLMSGGTVFCEGDKVMCTSNDYQYLVFNGDIGKITKIKTEIDDGDEERYFTVDFDGVRKKFPLRKADDFVLAYAMTIHKSQGSEYDIVVMPLTYQNYVMLQRNLLYTGITRAKKIFVLVGDEGAVRVAVKNAGVEARNSHLADLIREKAQKAGK